MREKREEEIEGCLKQTKDPTKELLKVLFGLVCPSFSKAICGDSTSNFQKLKSFYNALTNARDYIEISRSILGI